MSSEQLQNSCEQENTCVVCFKNVDIYSIGVCDHPVCYECSTRMRVLCKQKECPICRGDMPKVIYTKDVEPFGDLLRRVERSNLQDVKYGVHFQGPSIQRAYYRLLEFTCQVCPRGERRWPFKTFNQLRDHMRREHELFYCDLCVDNLKIFSFERKCYTRSELAQHRRKGDTDNTSHRGHPLCEFCDQRYMDSDELFRHLRRDHLYCHFCDADGKHQYYSSYEDLRLHFLEDHYLCEEGDCKNEQFTSVFRSDIDLKAHIASVHSKHLSRAANKQARTIEVEFNFGPRRTEQGGQRGGRKQQNHRTLDDASGPVGYENHNLEPGGQVQQFMNSLQSANFPSLNSSELASSSAPTSRTSVTFTSKITPKFTGEEFPTLGGAPAVPRPSVAVTNKVKKEEYPSLGTPRNITITKSSNMAGPSKPFNLQNFPSLGDSSKGTSTVKVTLNSQERPQSARPNVSIHFNHKHNGVVTTRISTVPTTTVQVRPVPVDAFPALGSSSTPAPVQQWVQAKSKKPQEPRTKTVAPAPVLPPSSLSEFPNLSKKEEPKPKKTSSVTVPISNSWSSGEPDSQARKYKPESVQSKAQENGKKDKKQKKQNNGVKVSESKGSDSGDNKSKVKKKKNKSDETVFISASTSNNADNLESSTLEKTAKKMSTLKIDPLEVPDGNANESSDDFPILGPKPPPGISIRPPPGFNFAPKSNDLTFTSSSGQSYSILPSQTYCQPTNFTNRNSSLIQKFFSVLKTNEAMHEFKSYSDLFRHGGYPAEKYFDHCELVLGKSFEKVFPELLVLLPDIEKQQELYRVYKRKGKPTGLDECATCKQVIFSKELKTHLNNHYMENHFPTLGHAVDSGNVWKK